MSKSRHFSTANCPARKPNCLLKRLTRDAELRESFGRYALIGESLRGREPRALTRGFAGRVNCAIDGEPMVASSQAARARPPRWWRPVAGAAVAAGVAAVAVVALQQRADVPTWPSGIAGHGAERQRRAPRRPKEAISYTVPRGCPKRRRCLPAARLTNYVFAHSKYSSGLGQSNVLSGSAGRCRRAGSGGQWPSGERRRRERRRCTTAAAPGRTQRSMRNRCVTALVG